MAPLLAMPVPLTVVSGLLWGESCLWQSTALRPWQCELGA